MMTSKTVNLILLATMLAASSVCAQPSPRSLEARPEVVEAWKDMRFGMFLCWGPVSLTGKEIGWSRGEPSWGRRPGVRGGAGTWR